MSYHVPNPYAPAPASDAAMEVAASFLENWEPGPEMTVFKLARVIQSYGDQREAEAKAEIRHLREAISFAWRDLRSLAAKGGTGADGDLWQKHNEIADKLFSDSVWMHKDDREFVPRSDYDKASEARRSAEFECNLAKGAEAAGFRRGVEAAAKYVNGDGGKVIPGVVGFATLLSGNNMPDMSGDARNRLRPHARQQFDAVMSELAARILALLETREAG